MQIKSLKIFDSTVAANGSWIDISNLVQYSVHILNLDGANVWVETSNDPNAPINGANALSAPSAPTLSQYAYGALASQGTYYVKVTYITKWGESLPSTESSLAISDGNVLVVSAPTPDAAGIATGWNVYISKTTGTEVLQTAPAYTSAYTIDSTPGVHFAINGALSLSQKTFVLTNGWQNTGIVVPSASTAGGPANGVNSTGYITSSAITSPPPVGTLDQTQVTLDTSTNQAMYNPSGLNYKWLRVRKGSGGSVETIAWLCGQNG